MVEREHFIKAVKSGDLILIQTALRAEPDLLREDFGGGPSPVLLAMYYGRPEVAKLLVRWGAPLDIFEAGAVGELEKAREWVESQPELVNAFSPDGFQPLGLASFFGHLEIARYLIAHGAEVNTASRNAQQVQPLHSAVAGGHLEIAEILIETGARINARQAHGYTPLHGAAQNGQLEMVKLLVENGAELVARGDDGLTALEFAQKQGHREVEEFLSRLMPTE